MFFHLKNYKSEQSLEVHYKSDCRLNFELILPQRFEPATPSIIASLAVTAANIWLQFPYLKKVKFVLLVILPLLVHIQECQMVTLWDGELLSGQITLFLSALWSVKYGRY